MKPHSRLLLALFATALLCSLSAPAKQPSSPRLELTADAGWKFLLGDPSGAESPSFADASWRSVDLPHDWSIESAPDKDAPSGSGGGFFPGGTGWYRKAFTAPADWKGKRVTVEFDGVYENATVYLNGNKLGTHPYGYTSFTFDLTPQLSFTGPNLLAVRVDNSAQPNSRWYSGSGIYRHVHVIVTELTHITYGGVFITTPEASAAAAKVSIHTNIANNSSDQSNLTLETTLYYPVGKKIGTAQSPVSAPAGQETETAQQISVSNPSLWSPGSPNLYRAVSVVRKDGKVIDEVTSTFGIRSLGWSAEKGLLLNGKPIKLTGGSVHHDNGPLGAAAFDRAEERKVELLKASGANAVRTAHNPPSPALLDACDRLGILVLDEPFDVWEAHKVKYDYATYFAEWWKRDITSMVLRDRNHPSIVIWGIGNEIPELETDKGAVLGKQLADQVRSLDNTRPLTLAFPGTTTTPNAEAVFSLLDVTGYNYNLIPSYAADHRQLPARIMLTTESLPAKAFPLWKITQDNPYVIGDLTWTAMDYLGESGIGAWSYGTPEQAKAAPQISGMMSNLSFIDKMFAGMANGVDVMAEMTKSAPQDPATKALAAIFMHGYPWHAAYCGDMDLTGHRKPQSYYRDILWNGGDRVYATVRLPQPEGKMIIAIGWSTYPTLPSWTWPGQEGREMQVEVYSGTEKVRLYLNNKLIGEQPTGRDQEFRTTFSVPYAPGTLKAEGIRGGAIVAEAILTTSGKATGLKVTPDRGLVDANGEDLAYFTVEAVDADGRWQPNADAEVQFSITGPGTIAAVGNGDAQDPASYHANSRKLFDGRALVIVRTTTQSGSITVTAKTPGLNEATAKIESKSTRRQDELR
jgi:beta-galactosidase